jgi:hypothetical protein
LCGTRANLSITFQNAGLSHGIRAMLINTGNANAAPVMVTVRTQPLRWRAS